MTSEEIILLLISLPFIIGTFLPLSGGKHWLIRGFDFIRIQSAVVLTVTFLFSFILITDASILVRFVQFTLLIALITQIKIISPYIILKNEKHKPSSGDSQKLTILSVNVLQSNDCYHKLIELVKKLQPDILLTIESNKAWEDALEEIENDYQYSEKVPKENTYGMHFYTNLKADNIKVHYFLTDERPTIEAHLEDRENNKFVFWGIHPPPPSPTEEVTSKKKDGELLSIAKLIRKSKTPSLVIGDFNSVCWSNVSTLFAKTSDLKDARKRRGFFSTFPVKPFFMRFPIDLLYHSEEIKIYHMNTLPEIGSDHLPLYSEFSVHRSKTESPKSMKKTEKEEVEEIITEGKEAEKSE
ncbi:endonuclease/exonuclease/phosphatase family protein [uncultured Arcticibacterium sp.]|uniref:endonuclease/exonuclease/phosphatase family protein n=1 Tax=uncultured Arcticibacterium sp. TaxID=2173042 RepID=UPI0030F81DA3